MDRSTILSKTATAAALSGVLVLTIVISGLAFAFPNIDVLPIAESVFYIFGFVASMIVTAFGSDDPRKWMLTFVVGVIGLSPIIAVATLFPQRGAGALFSIIFALAIVIEGTAVFLLRKSLFAKAPQHDFLRDTDPGPNTFEST